MVPQNFSLLQSPDGLVGGGEVIAYGQSFGVGHAKDPLGINESVLQEWDGPIQTPSGLVGAGEVVADAQGAGVRLAQDLLGVGDRAFQERNGLIQPPRGPVRVAKVIAGIKVSGWVSPRTCSRSATVRSRSGMA